MLFLRFSGACLDSGSLECCRDQGWRKAGLEMGALDGPFPCERWWAFLCLEHKCPLPDLLSCFFSLPCSGISFFHVYGRKKKKNNNGKALGRTWWILLAVGPPQAPWVAVSFHSPAHDAEGSIQRGAKSRPVMLPLAASHAHFCGVSSLVRQALLILWAPCCLSASITEKIKQRDCLSGQGATTSLEGILYQP